MKIFIAEDETLVLKTIEFRLKKEGYETITVTDGREAKQKLETENPDLIITDIMMPYHTGLEVINFVRSNERLKHIPIIVLSAIGLEKTVLEAFELGADDFITKPFSPSELLIRIKKNLRK